ncbi:hypothetical protein CWI37_0148p0020 [Hamiltosporidium tvaerminnensis]|uniref:Uncharacterized protein n=1 Tax=Hamiltosporidium tvaerminnensis TaxID=1176355 RepID=A0A4Q9L9K4_9MICR|nr:hypothetical protein CWI37_0148p0020 [Hamiltosporidium tvaerminnensis]
MKGNGKYNKGSRISIIRVSNKRVNKGSNRRVSKGSNISGVNNIIIIKRGVNNKSSNISGINNTIII